MQNNNPTKPKKLYFIPQQCCRLTDTYLRSIELYIYLKKIVYKYISECDTSIIMSSNQFLEQSINLKKITIVKNIQLDQILKNSIHVLSSALTLQYIST